MSVTIHAIATATPRFSLSQPHALRLAQKLEGAPADRARLLKRVYQATAIDRRGVAIAQRDDDDLRHFYPVLDGKAPINDEAQPGRPRGPGTHTRMAAYENLAPDLGQSAGHAALHRARVEPERISHLVTVSCTGFSAPGLDIALVDRLKLRRDVQRTHIGFMGCHGAINGLRLASAFAAERPDAAVLLCCVELCSLHYQYGGDAGAAVATALFGDGAAAAVITAGPSGANHPDAGQLVDTASIILPDSAESMSWRIGENGFEMTLSPDVPELIRRHLRQVVSEFLGRNGLTIDGVGGWAIHPGGPKVIASVLDCLELPVLMGQPSSEVLSRHGNMSSPTVLFIMEELRRAGVPRPWVGVAFGPGLAVELALIQ